MVNLWQSGVLVLMYSPKKLPVCLQQQSKSQVEQKTAADFAVKSTNLHLEQHD